MILLQHLEREGPFMVEKLLEQNIGIYVMAVLCAIGIIGNSLCLIGWNSLLNATEHIGTTKHKLIQEMKKKFEACYKMHINVNNVDKYVDKYIYKYKFCGLYLYTWGNICGQLLCITGFFGVICSILACAYHCGQNTVMVYILTTVIIVGMLITYQYRVDAMQKSKKAAVNLGDYFENYLQGRLQAEETNPELAKQYKAEWNRDAEDKRRAVKVKKEKKVRKDNRREEIEKLKQELVEELKQERLLQKQKEAKRLEAEKAMEQGKEEIAAATVERIKAKTEKRLEKEPEVEAEAVKQTLQKEEEQILQDILKEYLA